MKVAIGLKEVRAVTVLMLCPILFLSQRKLNLKKKQLEKKPSRF